MIQNLKPRRATERDLLIFTTPALWPTRPILPIVRYRPNGDVDCGVLYEFQNKPACCNHRTTVFLSNIFELPAAEAEILKLPKEEYDTVEKMAAAGWVVD